MPDCELSGSNEGFIFYANRYLLIIHKLEYCGIFLKFMRF